MRPPSRGVALLAAALLGGCSLALSGPAANRPRAEAPRCDTGKGLIALDGLIAAGVGVGGLAAIGNDEAAVGGALLLLGAVFAGAAYRADGNVSECRAQFASYVKESTIPDEPDRLSRREHVLPRPRIAPRVEPASAPAIAPTTEPEPPPTALTTPSAPLPPPIKAAPPRPPPAKPEPQDDWSQFWREVP